VCLAACLSCCQALCEANPLDGLSQAVAKLVEPQGAMNCHQQGVCVCRAATGMANKLWGNEAVMRYLAEGVYEYWLPMGDPIYWEDPEGKPGCDFFGMNHYARWGAHPPACCSTLMVSLVRFVSTNSQASWEHYTCAVGVCTNIQSARHVAGSWYASTLWF
jgi:hypothetical protein